MLDVTPYLLPTTFPAIERSALEILQLNLGFRCNQSCQHCHVDAGPNRTEQMSLEVAEQALAFMRAQHLKVVDITGGAPELNPHFRYLVRAAVDAGAHVMDRCNLTVLELPEQAGLAKFLAEHKVEVVASMPCYLEENVDAQRGKGAYADSIRGLQRLNALGYGESDSNLVLNLVYNPLGPVLPPPQCGLERDYREQLDTRYGIRFNHLLTLTNMPIKRFGSMLLSKGQFDDYFALLKSSHADANLERVMCRKLISVDWQGYVYDCDFNQMLDMPLGAGASAPVHIGDLLQAELRGRPIRVAEHCYGCTAGQGSSCGGALDT